MNDQCRPTRCRGGCDEAKTFPNWLIRTRLAHNPQSKALRSLHVLQASLDTAFRRTELLGKTKTTRHGELEDTSHHRPLSLSFLELRVPSRLHVTMWHDIHTESALSAFLPPSPTSQKVISQEKANPGLSETTNHSLCESHLW